MSAKDTKKKDELKEFTVGSVAPTGTGKTKKPVAGPKVEISEKEFPVLSGIIKGHDVDAFKKEVGRVLSMVQNSKDKSKDKVEKAYAMALAIVDNGKVVK